jgi:hypothetical protein
MDTAGSVSEQASRRASVDLFFTTCLLGRCSGDAGPAGAPDPLRIAG